MTDRISPRTGQPDQDDQEVPEFDQYVHYEDDGWTVVCDRSNPAAWIRSTDVRPCRR